MIIREKLKFPSGFSTAVLIGVLHGKPRQTDDKSSALPSGFASLAAEEETVVEETEERPPDPEWRSNMRLLLISFLVSGLITFVAYFLPAMRDIPIFGFTAASSWLWTLNPSLACMQFLFRQTLFTECFWRT